MVVFNSWYLFELLLIKTLLESRKMKINSHSLISELKSFVALGGAFAAKIGENDDLVMACAIACWIRDTALTANVREAKYAEAMLSAFTTKRAVLDTTVKGMKKFEQTVITKNVNEKVINLPFFIG